MQPYGYGAKSRWESPRVYLGANGVPLGPKNGSKPLKVTMPHNSNFRPPRCHRFRPKCDLTVMAPNHGGDPLGSILGPMGSHGVQNMPNHGGDPLGSILGPMGSHWVQKMGQNRKKLPCPKIRIFDYPTVIDFGQNSTLRLWRQIKCGDTLGSILGPMGSHWVQKMGQNRKNYHATKFEFSTTPRSSISTKMRPYGYGAKSRWGPPRVHLGANGVPLGPKNGSKP